MWWPSRDDLSKRGFTDSAVRIIQQILSRASERGLVDLNDATIAMLALWTLIRWERKVGLVALETIGVYVLALTGQLDLLLDKRRDDNPGAAKDGILVFRKTGRPVPVANKEKKLEPLLTQTEQEARDMNHNWVASEHLLLAVIRVADSELSSLLSQHLISHETIKQTVLKLLAAR